MAFKSSTQPLCRFCGKKIGKRTDAVYFGEQRDSSSLGGGFQQRTARPATKEEAQRLVNGQIVGVRWASERAFITRAAVWDGETYRNEFFCKDECATMLGYLMAIGGRCTTDYTAAVARQSEGVK